MMTSCSTIHSVSRLPSPGFSLIGHLNLDSELELELDFDLGLDDANNGPAAATISASDPATAIAQPTAVPASRRQFTAHSLDTTLPFFFPQTSNNVRVKFARRKMFAIRVSYSEIVDIVTHISVKQIITVMIRNPNFLISNRTLERLVRIEI